MRGDAFFAGLLLRESAVLLIGVSPRRLEGLLDLDGVRVEALVTRPVVTLSTAAAVLEGDLLRLEGADTGVACFVVLDAAFAGEAARFDLAGLTDFEGLGVVFLPEEVLAGLGCLVDLVVVTFAGTTATAALEGEAFFAGFLALAGELFFAGVAFAGEALLVTLPDFTCSKDVSCTFEGELRVVLAGLLDFAPVALGLAGDADLRVVLAGDGDLRLALAGVPPARTLAMVARYGDEGGQR